MKDTLKKIYPLLLKDEGGFTWEKTDPGGPTKYGITQDRLSLWRKREVTVDEVRALTVEEAYEIYQAMYWNALSCDNLPAGLDYAVFDFGVNSGPSRSAKALQKLVGADPDGSIGEKTLKAVAEYVSENGLEKTIKRFNTNRSNYLKTLHHFNVYGNGWLDRVDRLTKNSIALI